MGTTTIPVSQLNKMATQPAEESTIDASAITNNVEKSDPVATPAPTLRNNKIKISKSERIADRINNSLTNYLEAPIGSPDRIRALNEVTQMVLDGNAKKSVLDSIYRKFVENRHSDALHPRNALQGLQSLSADDNLRSRLFFTVMAKLASGEKNIQLNLDTIQSILGEEFSVWASIKMESIRRRKA